MSIECPLREYGARFLERDTFQESGANIFHDVWRAMRNSSARYFRADGPDILERPPSWRMGVSPGCQRQKSRRELLLRRACLVSRILVPRNPGDRRCSTQQQLPPGFWRCHPGETPFPTEGVSPGFSRCLRVVVIVGAVQDSDARILEREASPEIWRQIPGEGASPGFWRQVPGEASCFWRNRLSPSLQHSDRMLERGGLSKNKLPLQEPGARILERPPLSATRSNRCPKTFSNALENVLEHELENV